MSDEQIPEEERASREILSQMRGLWDELAKVSDWIWRVESQNDRIEHRLTHIESQYRNLHRYIEDD